MPAASTYNRFNSVWTLHSDVLTHPQLYASSMQFLFVSTGICSPAYFSAEIALHHLAAC
jgi:hypothetical protein